MKEMGIHWQPVFEKQITIKYELDQNQILRIWEECKRTVQNN